MSLLGRRFFLRGLAAAPAAAKVVADQMTAAGISGIGVSGQMGGGIVGPPSSNQGPTKFTDLMSWFKVAEPMFREQAKYVQALDPDIVLMRLPLPTKVRMQQGRNYERIVAGQRKEFTKRIGKFGFFEWWD